MDVNSSGGLVCSMEKNGRVIFMKMLMHQDGETVESSAGTSTQATADEQQDPAKGIEGPWQHEAVLLLIESFRELRSQFSNHSIKRKSVWESIAKRISANGHAVTSEMCDRKWRNLKISYRNVICNKKQNGRSKKVWRYFDLMDEIYGQDDTLTIPVFQIEEHRTPDVEIQTASDSPLSHYVLPHSAPSAASLATSSMLESEPEEPITGMTNPLRKKTARRKRKASEDKPAWFVKALEQQREEDKQWRIEIQKSIQENTHEQRRRNDLIEELISIIREQK